MINRLRKKLIMLFMMLFSSIFLLILIFINWENYDLNIRQSRRELDRVINRIGVEAFFDTNNATEALHDERYATVRAYMPTDNSNSAISPTMFEIGSNLLADTSDEQVIAYAQEMFDNNRNRGRKGFLIYVRHNSYPYSTGIFMESSFVKENCKNLLIMSLISAAIGCTLLLFASVFLSNWLVRPVHESLTAQQTFISDAGHELKTPLTVINANLNLLQPALNHTSTEPLDYIRMETNHMNTLVNQMLALAKMESPQHSYSFHPVNLGDITTGIILPFESVIYEKKLTLQDNISPNVTVIGSKELLQHLVSVLMDNAVKHCSENGCIHVSVTKERRKATLTVANTGEPIPADEQDKIFQRFYRSDKSRNNSENRYGLGLSIASRIAELHHGRIQVKCHNGITSFVVTLPDQ